MRDVDVRRYDSTLGLRLCRVEDRCDITYGAAICEDGGDFDYGKGCAPESKLPEVHEVEVCEVA